jgi:hypothetical protein
MTLIAAHGPQCKRTRELAAFFVAAAGLLATVAAGAAAPAGADASEPGFWIGKPDGSAAELGGARTNPESSYLYFGPNGSSPPLVPAGDSLLTRFRAGPMAGADEFIFCARKSNEADWHWYANVGYYADDADRKAWREGAKLYRWNAATGALATLLADPRGGIRDPQVHYDGKKILFSYRKGGTENYLLYEIAIDGTGLRQLTDGAYDDIEPAYLPDGQIVFVSTRAKRWVNCWFTQVAVLHRCDADGRNIRAVSSNNEQDNGYERTAAGSPRAGRVILTADRGPVYSHSYYTLTVANLFSDGRNQPRSNYAPRRLGSATSRLLSLLDGSHYGVKADPHQKTMLRLWIETGAAYPGTYAALGSGMIGGYLEEQQIDTDADWPAAKAAADVIGRRCVSCHDSRSRRLPSNLSDELGVTLWQSDLMERSPSNSRHLVYNLTRPEKSLILLAPLSEAAGGFGLCREPATRQPATVFASTSDADYQQLLALCAAGKARLDAIKRFDMPEFRPPKEWMREMKRYGILPAAVKSDEPINVYATERSYWRSLWHTPSP